MRTQTGLLNTVNSSNEAFDTEFNRILNLALEGYTMKEICKVTDSRHRWMIKTAMSDATNIKNDEMLAESLKEAQNKFNI